MNVDELIDLALSQGDNVPQSDAAYVQRRRRALSFLRELVPEVWWSGEHKWKRTETDLTVLVSTGQVAVPWNYDDLGPYGDLYRLVSGILQLPALEEKQESTIQEARTGNNPTDRPTVFAMYGQDPDTFLDLIQLPINPVEITLRLAFMRKPPKLIDAGDPDQVSFTVTITRSGTTATVTTPSAHGFKTFDYVIIAGANQSDYNGRFQIAVTGSTTFTYTVANSPVTPATGTITVAEDVVVANAALNEIPERFHVPCLLPGLKAKLRESKGDARWKTYKDDYQTALAALKQQVSRFRSERRRPPNFFGVP